jgi:hypothetical protein
MKKCTQCGQELSDDTKFCFKCGGSNFEPIEEAAGTYQQPIQQPPQQVPQQPPQQSYYAQQQPAQPYRQAPAQSYQQPASYQQPSYQQPPAYQAQPVYNNNEPVTIGNYLLFFLLMCIPIFNIVYFIIVAVGGPKYKKSLSNFARAGLIWGAIILVIYIVLIIVFGATLFSTFNGGGYYGY